MFSARRHAVSAFKGARALSTSSSESGLGVSELSLVLRAGSRYEPAAGVAHLLKASAFADSAARSGLRLQREAELLGGSVSARLGKEHLVLQAKFLREDLPYFVEALANATEKPLFRDYQFVEETVPLARLEAETARASAEYVAVEGAYEAAFRRGLANPLLVSAESPVSLAQVKEYASTAYTTGQAQVVARNVNGDDLKKFAGEAFGKLPESPSGAALTSEQSKFFSGESRVKHAGAEQVAVLAFPTQSKPCLDALRYVLSGKTLKWSPGFGLLSNLALTKGIRISTHNDVYSDASLFYVVVKAADAALVTEGVKAAADAIKSVAQSLDSQVAAKAIATAKFGVAEAEGSLLQAIKGQPDLAKVSAESISAAAKSLVEGKKVLSVVGQTYALPYADELF